MMKQFLGSLAIIGVMVAWPAQAEIITTTAEGGGNSRQAATMNALAAAVAQVNGGSIQSSRGSVSTATSGVSVDTDTGETRSYSGTSTADASAVMDATGQIAAYEVLSVTRDDTGTFLAKVKADVHRYTVPSVSGDRRRLALYPVETSRSGYDYEGGVSGERLASDLHTLLESELVDSRRFAILDRATTENSDRELALVASDRTPPEEKARLQRMLGADYLVQATITEAWTHVATRHIEITGQTERTWSNKIAATVRVLIPATGEVKFNESFKVTNARTRKAGVTILAHKIATGMTEGIFPLRIIKVMDDGRRGVINQGGKSVKVGERMDLFREGEKLLDPYTGESLGGQEHPVGLVRVDKVADKVSYVSLVSGTGIEANLLARRSTAKPAPGPRPTPVPQATSGVQLPFD